MDHLTPTKEAFKLGRDAARNILASAHPRVASGADNLYALIEPLRDVRDRVRQAAGGFSLHTERPLYQAFLRGLASVVRPHAARPAKPRRMPREQRPAKRRRG